MFAPEDPSFKVRQLLTSVLGSRVDEAAVLSAELHVHFEDLVSTIWECERWARIQERIDAAARIDEKRAI
jgi:hypothetical protein